jgi:beta-glucosidase
MFPWTVTVSADVTNTGHRSGSDVVQLYVGDPSSAAVPEPPNQLQGFQKVALGPGQTRRVTFSPRPDHLLAHAVGRWSGHATA